ncbi:uncharacterized protein KZ484_007840 isoform 2-T3 [Pholidichthys leucotaenia]
MIQVGLLREDNNFPWIAIISWLKRIFSKHYSADFRCLIERGIATTLSLGSDTRMTFLESDINFNFVGPICDSIGVERSDLLEMRDFSERAQSIEVTNGLILELGNFVNREKIAPIFLVNWLRNFNPEFCKNGNVQRAYQILKTKIKRLKTHYCNYETRSNRRNVAMESLLQSPFELVPKKETKFVVKKRKRDETDIYDKVVIKNECEDIEIMYGESSGMTTDPVPSQIKQAATDNGGSKDMGVSNSGGASNGKPESLTLLDIAMLSVQKLKSVYGEKSETSKRVALDLLKNQYALTFKENLAMKRFENQIEALGEDISLVSPIMFLNYNASFLVDLHDAVEQHIMTFENEIILSAGEKLGRDRLPEFKNFVNMSESATSRYIHMACDILSPPHTPKKQNYRKYWLAFCKEKQNHSKLEVIQPDQFNSYYEAATGLIHHHKEIALFFSDLLALSDDRYSNIILESVAADAEDSVIQSLVCVVAIVYLKIIGPYWQLLKSGGEYALYSQYLLFLYQKFLDWSKNPSTLLEPEEVTNVFMQFPLQEKRYDGVFEYCGRWHTNRDLIKACLKRTIKVIAGITGEHLKDFLPGGKFSQVPSPALSTQLVSCTFSVLMAEYPFTQAYPLPNKKKEQSSKRSSDSSQEDDDLSDSSDDSSEESSSVKVKTPVGQKEERKYSPNKVEKTARVQEQIEERMDRDYIIAQVESHGGPCRSQTDVDKMLLRFDGRPRAEKREALRCEILYQKMILNNTSPHLSDFRTPKSLLSQLKLALPRVKPGYSLVWAPKKTKPKCVPVVTTEATNVQSESSSTQEGLNV